MPSLTLVCNHANVLMMVCCPSPSRVSSRFISTRSAAGGSEGGGTGSGTGGGTTTFLFCTFGIRVQVTTGDLDLLRKL